jgi:hypothetical protein
MSKVNLVVNARQCVTPTAVVNTIKKKKSALKTKNAQTA